MVYRRWLNFYNDACYQIPANFTAHPAKFLKDNEEQGVEKKKKTDEVKNRKRKVCDCEFDSEQCDHVISV